MLLKYNPPTPSSDGSVSINKSVLPPPSTVSATCATSFVTKSNTLTNSGCWCRNSPVRVIKPGPKALTLTLEPRACNRRSSSYVNNMLHNFESLYALSASNASPLTISNALPSRVKPSRSPNVAPLPTLPPGLEGSCTSDEVTTTRGCSNFSLASNLGSNKLANKK